MQFISIKGEEYPIKFGIGLMKRLARKYKLNKIVEAEQLISSIEWDDLGWILLSGLENGAKEMDEKCALGEQEVERYVESDLRVMGEILTILTNDLNPGSEEDEQAEEAEKEEKKVPEAPKFKT